MDNQDKLDSVIKRGDVIIALLVLLLSKESLRLKTLQNQVAFLDSFGLKSKEIGNILNKTDSHIRKELTLTRKKNI